MIKRIPSYLTSDNRIHTSKIEALKAEQKIELRSIIQRGYNGTPIRNGTLTVTDAIHICLENGHKIVDTMRRFDKMIRHEEKQEEKQEGKQAENQTPENG